MSLLLPAVSPTLVSERNIGSCVSSLHGILEQSKTVNIAKNFECLKRAVFCLQILHDSSPQHHLPLVAEVMTAFANAGLRVSNFTSVLAGTLLAVPLARYLESVDVSGLKPDELIDLMTLLYCDAEISSIRRLEAFCGRFITNEFFKDHGIMLTRRFSQLINSQRLWLPHSFMKQLMNPESLSDESESLVVSLLEIYVQVVVKHFDSKNEYTCELDLLCPLVHLALTRSTSVEAAMHLSTLLSTDLKDMLIKFLPPVKLIISIYAYAHRSTVVPPTQAVDVLYAAVLSPSFLKALHQEGPLPIQSTEQLTVFVRDVAAIRAHESFQDLLAEYPNCGTTLAEYEGYFDAFRDDLQTFYSSCGKRKGLLILLEANMDISDYSDLAALAEELKRINFMEYSLGFLASLESILLISHANKCVEAIEFNFSDSDNLTAHFVCNALESISILIAMCNYRADSECVQMLLGGLEDFRARFCDSTIIYCDFDAWIKESFSDGLYFLFKSSHRYDLIGFDDVKMIGDFLSKFAVRHMISIYSLYMANCPDCESSYLRIVSHIHPEFVAATVSLTCSVLKQEHRFRPEFFNFCKKNRLLSASDIC